MRRTQNIIVIVTLFAFFLSIYPITRALESSEYVEKGTVDLACMFTPISGYRKIIGSYSANGTIDAWLSDTTDSAAEYLSEGLISGDVLWSKTGISGTFEVLVEDESGPYYFYFGNKNGISLIKVDFNFDLKKPTSIAGFELVFCIFGILSAFAITYLRKKLDF